MAKRVFSAHGLTSGTGTANNTALTTSQYMAVKGGSSTQTIEVSEIYIQGASGSSAPANFIFQRVSVVETTATALAAPSADGPMHSATAALSAPAVTFIAAATQPTTSNVTTDAKLVLGLNLFGGIVRWVAAPGAVWRQVGNTATLGESVLNTWTGSTSGTFSAHIIYEPY